ncbi:endonuclease/exonuclease/phosphatase family protein [Sulfitobacter sp. F26169L]|uniref:endonuclease/exonuclease/phosphatase family protein n=1 Tax=Sulfitobacter sp. F26169L TaxID=2996015 RepID=UPI002260C215|nr:endonuclease/exonuclease/phosphatase family protein [Sulfitobacter sp. F26169L]MCX7566689.1 endonuclease/exonuclease/phosphatase family protein [Sulfitobacter sp. F26169L]
MTPYLEWLVYGFAAFLVVLTLLPLSKLRFGIVRGPAFFRLQMFWIALALAVVALMLPNGVYVAMVLAATAIVQAIYIAKFTPIWVRQSLDVDEALRADDRRHISLLAANVKKSNRDYDALVSLVRDQLPDIVMAIEVDDDWISALVKELEGDYAHWVKVPKDTGYGICVMSRLELSDTTVREIVTEGVPSIRTAVTLRSGAKVRLYVVHPEPPVIDHDTKGRDSEIAHVGLEAAQDPLPAIVTGDLNDVAWSTTTRSFQRLSGLLDPRVGRGFYNTFNAFHWWARWPLDHLFHDPQFRLLGISRLEKIGSDHFPMLFKLALAELPVQGSDTGVADEAEQEDIEDMIAEEKRRDRGPIGSDWED